MITDLQAKKKRIAVLGLGYVGLPLALEFARKYSVIGFDINDSRIAQMRNKIDPSQELEKEAFDDCDIEFTSNQDDLRRAHFFIITVPTPIDNHNIPNLEPLLLATHLVAEVLKKGDYVVFESTVYPGATEEECVPILKKISKLKFGSDFKIGFSPERINPGDKENSLVNVLKIVSGNDDEALETIAELYSSIIKKGVYKASSIKVAEAAKIIENTQRDVNIALVNELSMLFAKMGINTNEVIEAAATKWNFYKLTPGLVGGHCIGVDPYYLTYKASQLKHPARLISAGRAINDEMPTYVAHTILKKLNNAGKVLKNSRVLVMGATFKENVSDIRNSKIFDVVKELQSFNVQGDIIDPHADAEQAKEYYGCTIVPEPTGVYDAIVVAVKHKEYENLPEEFFRKYVNPPFILIDLKSAYYNKFQDVVYFSL